MPIIFSFIHFFERKVSAEYRRRFISLLEENPKARLLDLGCFQGDFSSMMAERIGTNKVFGIDALEEVRNEVQARGIQYYHSDLNERFPFDDESFDVVCASHLIEHLSNTDLFIKEIHRVLVHGGYAIISTPNLAAVYNILLLMLGWQPFPAHVSDEAPWAGMCPLLVRDKENHYLWLHHRRIFTPKALKDLLEYHGLKVERITGSGFLLFPALIAKFFCLVGKRYANVIIVKARKEIKH